MPLGGQRTPHGKVPHREEGGQVQVYAEQAEARPIRHQASGGNIPGELDRRIRLSGTHDQSLTLMLTSELKQNGTQEKTPLSNLMP